jgi:hypothetical protein
MTQKMLDRHGLPSRWGINTLMAKNIRNQRRKEPDEPSRIQVRFKYEYSIYQENLSGFYEIEIQRGESVTIRKGLRVSYR